LGAGLGILLGQGTVRMVSQTINDLYFTTTVQANSISILSLVKGMLLGVLAALVTASFPAWEAASVPPRYALIRSGLENKTRKNVAWAAFAGAGAIVTALLLFLIPSTSLYFGFGGTLLAVLGAALFSSAAVVVLVNLAGLLAVPLFWACRPPGAAQLAQFAQPDRCGCGGVDGSSGSDHRRVDHDRQFPPYGGHLAG